MGQITANALAWAGFRSAGGMRKSLLFCCAYGAVVIGILVLIMAGNPRGRTEVFDGLPRFLLGAQMAIMGLFVCVNILNTIQKDGTSKMLESHRLMPIDPRLVVLGYIGGAAAPVAPIGVLNFMLGGISAGIAGLPLDWWVAANLVVITFCAFLWAIAAGTAFNGAAAALMCAAPLGIVLISGGAAGVAMPSILMLASPVLGPSVFDARVLGAEELMLWTTSAGLQCFVAWIFVEMGGRRFRSPDLPPLTARWGIALIAVLALAGAIGVNCEHPAVNIRRPEPLSMAMGTCMTLLVAASAVIVSVVAAERIQHPAKRLHLLERWGLMVVGATVAYACGFAAAVPKVDALGEHVLWTAAAFLLALMLMYAWAKWLYAVGAGFGGFVLAMFAVAALPPLVAGLMFLDSTGHLTATGRVIAQISPMAMITAIWSERSIFAEPQALVFQALIAGLGMLLVWRRRHGVLSPMLKPAAR